LKENKSARKRNNESALKYESALQNERALKIDKHLKIYECPEIITGANFHFAPVKLCILNNDYALCILLRKIPSSDESANILELLYTF
jgi:hypothetical protein